MPGHNLRNNSFRFRIAAGLTRLSDLERCFFMISLFRLPRQGWVLIEMNVQIQWITKLFIEFVVVETKQFVSSNSNVILTR